MTPLRTVQLYHHFTKGIGLAILLAIVFLFPSQASAKALFQVVDIQNLCFAVSDESGATQDDTLVRLNRATSQTETIGAGTGTSGIEAIAFGPNGILFAADADQLGTLDMDTGVFTALAQPFGTAGSGGTEISLRDVDSLSFDITGNVLYGAHRRGSGDPDLLFAINPNTGAHIPEFFGAGVDYVPVEVIADEAGNLLDDVDDIAVDPQNGDFYAALNKGGTGGILAVINPQTGAARRISTFNIQIPIQAMQR